LYRKVDKIVGFVCEPCHF